MSFDSRIYETVGDRSRYCLSIPKQAGSFRFDCLLKFETKTDFHNMVFKAHPENVLLFSGNIL